MTTTQELKRYKYGYSSDEWGMGRSLGLIADPAGNVCLFADALTKLEALQVEVVRLEQDVSDMICLAAQRGKQRDTALARLAAIETQEPVSAQIRVPITSESGWSDWREINLSDSDREYRKGVETRKIYAAAGASPQPTENANHWHSLYLNKCQELHDEKARLGTEIETLELAAIDDAERHASPQPVQPSPAHIEMLRRVAHELRTYDPAADECKGKHVHKYWSDEITKAITQPAVLKPLTDKQVDECVRKVWGSFAEFDEVRMFTREIEAAHNIAQPAPELLYNEIRYAALLHFRKHRQVAAINTKETK